MPRPRPRVDESLRSEAIKIESNRDSVCVWKSFRLRSMVSSKQLAWSSYYNPHRHHCRKRVLSFLWRVGCKFQSRVWKRSVTPRRSDIDHVTHGAAISRRARCENRHANRYSSICLSYHYKRNWMRFPLPLGRARCYSIPQPTKWFVGKVLGRDWCRRRNLLKQKMQCGTTMLKVLMEF
jgi:hypothetical protein